MTALCTLRPYQLGKTQRQSTSLLAFLVSLDTERKFLRLLGQQEVCVNTTAGGLEFSNRVTVDSVGSYACIEQKLNSGQDSCVTHIIISAMSVLYGSFAERPPLLVQL